MDVSVGEGRGGRWREMQKRGYDGKNVSWCVCGVDLHYLQSRGSRINPLILNALLFSSVSKLTCV